MIQEWTRSQYAISTDPARLDIGCIHRYLSQESYWARNIPRPLLEKALAHSRCYGIYEGADQVGFGRLITDHATFAYLSDVFVLEGHRGKGLSKWLVECMLADPDVQGLRTWLLMTQDAQGLYARFGFKNHSNPERVMLIAKPDAYGVSTEGRDT